jgi:hypothetical protein
VSPLGPSEAGPHAAFVEASGGEYGEILAARLRHLVQVDQPLVLITQLGRSGGTLLLRLLDSHPECHVIPHELGTTFKSIEGLTDDRDAAWAALRNERQFRDLLHYGFRPRNKKVPGERRPAYPFLLPPTLHRRIFDVALDTAKRTGPLTDRRVIDAYLTAYFNAWLDNRNLETAVPKRWVVGFEPGEIQRRQAMARFQELYPDGRVVSTVRDPWSWWVSAREWSPRWHDRDVALEDWLRAARQTRKLKQQLGEAHLVVPFERLVREPQRTMRRVAAFLDVEFRPSLVEPTFNGLPIEANSSFVGAAEGISTDPAERGANGALAEADAAAIQEQAGDAYARLLKLAFR